MNGWAILWLALCTLDYGFTIAKHGTPRPNFNCFSRLVDMSISMFILYKAGLFN